MIVKVLCNSKGEYLKDVFLEDLSDPFDSTPAIGVAALWKTTDHLEGKKLLKNKYFVIICYENIAL